MSANIVDYEQFQYDVLDNAKKVYHQCDFSGIIQNSIKRMLDEKHVAKEGLKESIDVFNADFDKAIAGLNDVKRDILLIMNYYSE